MRTPPRIWPRGLLGSRSSMSVHNAFATTSYPPLPRRQRSFRRGRSGWPAPIVANRSSARRSFFRTQSPLQEIGKSILMIPVFLTNITAERVRTAMQSVRTRDLKEWAKKYLWRLCHNQASSGSPLRWHHLPARPQAGSYAERLPRRVMVRLRARRLSSSAHSASLR